MGTLSRQPKVFWLTSMVMLGERFSYYILTFALVLFVQQYYHLNDWAAFQMYSIFAALSYLTPVIGGYLADKIIGTERVLITGLLFEATGYLLTSFEGNLAYFYLALAFIIVGAGLFKAAPTSILGKSYDGPEDPRLDSGFTYFYQFINIGSTLASLVITFIAIYTGYISCFFIAAIIAYISAICYMLTHHKLVKSSYKSDAGNKPFLLFKWFVFIIGILVFILIFAIMLNYIWIYNTFFALALVCFIVYFIYSWLKFEISDRKRLIAAIVLILFGTAFFMMYNQLYSSMVLFIERVVDRTVFGYTLSPVLFQAVDPITIIIFSPILAWIYLSLSNRGKDLHITKKFALGLLLISLCFFILSGSAFLTGGVGKASALLVIFAIFVYAIGELLVAALGLSMITKTAPVKMLGVMMGAWYFIGMSLGGLLSGWEANLTAIPAKTTYMQEVHIYMVAFLIMGGIGLIATVVAFILSPWLQRMAEA